MKHFSKEYPLYYSVRLVMALLRLLPIHAVVFIGRVIGTLRFYLDTKHRATAYKNLKIAFAGEKTPQELTGILKKNFQNFGMNFAELLCLERFNTAYIKKYVSFSGSRVIDDAFARGKGIIFTGAHEGNWELSNAAIGLLGYPYSIVAEVQRNQLLNDMLDALRRDKGYDVIPVNVMLRQIIKGLKENRAMGVVIDHGGMQDGILVEFFGRRAWTPTGAVKLAMKFDSSLLLGYVYRVRGPYHAMGICPPARIEKTGDEEQDVRAALKRMNEQIEDFLRQHPEEYLWSYRRWKKSPDVSVIMLHDGTPASRSKCDEKLEQLKREHAAMDIHAKAVAVRHKNFLMKNALAACAALTTKYCQGCMRCGRMCLAADTYAELMSSYADMIIADRCVKAAGKFMARENFAKLYLV